MPPRFQIPAMQRRIIMAWLHNFGVPDCGFDEIEAVRSLLGTGKGPARINLPRALHVRRTAGELWIEEPADCRT